VAMRTSVRSCTRKSPDCRYNPGDKSVHVFHVDYEEITGGTDSATNYPLVPGDRLVVPRDPTPRPAAVASSASEEQSELRDVQRRLKVVEEKLDRILRAFEGARSEPGAKRR